MTGRNHHSVGMGVTTEMATPRAGLHGYRPASAAHHRPDPAAATATARPRSASGTRPRLWRSAPRARSTAGPRARASSTSTASWAREMNHWYPHSTDGTTPVEPDRRPRTATISPRTWSTTPSPGSDTSRRSRPSDPSSSTSRSAPPTRRSTSHAEWREKYRGRFDARAGTRSGSRRSPGRRSSASSPETPTRPVGRGLPHWDELDDDREAGRRALHGDLRRVRRARRRPGRPARRRARRAGRARQHAVHLPPRRQRRLAARAACAAPSASTCRARHPGRDRGHAARSTTWATPRPTPIYPVGWALAMDTPYQWTKQVASTLGGTRDGMIVHWPARDRGTGRDAPPVAPRHRHRCRRSSSAPGSRARTCRRRGPAADRGREHALHVRRRRRRRTGTPRSTSRCSATAASTTTAGAP